MKNLGINLNDGSGQVSLALCILLLSIFSQFCFINIVAYLVVLLLIDKEYVKCKMEQYKILKIVINFNRKTSLTYLTLEFIIYIYVNKVILSSCYKLVSAHYF
ncbi:hypothetical protein PNOK_m000108 (mitochondrion) [Pyrrhoderma noxium]|uniref:Uncharacterized protein n=1 Tax=Pyrrhoderma noxium TaxID=2282107 RepID=A0A541AXP3_9AGAM|nr:hypothetical protein PNOK_m000108 [Pyrrhoderma noxium]